MTDDRALASRLRSLLEGGVARRWYPLVLDREHGGYFTNVASDWALPDAQEKMIVTQARHVWTLAKLATFLDNPRYDEWARHGFAFLCDRMWDDEFGGFFQVRARDGGPTDAHGWGDEKRTYGNAFGVYALAALYGLTGEEPVLRRARAAFEWIEEHAADPEHGGYFQFLTREGRPFFRGGEHLTRAPDAKEVGYKDQNSSIHLLEAYTELYRVWPDPRLRERLAGLLTLIRDTMVAPEGYLRLFFERDWRPVSFREAPAAVRAENYGLDHVSFGHDYETGFLMLEASHALGLQGDVRTLGVARRMLDHALENGWDRENGGFVDGGAYDAEGRACTVAKATKNWWAQAEALNALALFSRIFPDEPRYAERLRQQWQYVDRYVIDHERGDWFEGGLDRQPEFRAGPKSHLWKCTYHTSRALMNCAALLNPVERNGEIRELAEYWRKVAPVAP